jgi:hypothetical protein
MPSTGKLDLRDSGSKDAKPMSENDGNISTGRKIAFWAIMLSVPLLAALVGIYFVSYSTIPPIRVSLEGDNIIAYDPEIGFVPMPSGRSLTKFTTFNRPSFSYNLYTDQRGARISVPGQSGPARIDIMTIGCSFTWGHGFENEDTFAVKVAQRLGVSGSNFAMGSYGTVQSLQILRRNRDLSPKIVVYGFITDHLRRNVSPCAPSYYPFCLDVAHVAWDARDRPIMARPFSNGVRRERLQMKAQAGMLDPLTWIAHGVDVVFGRLTWLFSESGADDTRKEAALAFLLEEMARTVDNMGAKLLVVYIPEGYAPPPSALLRSVAKLNVLFLDMTDAFQHNRETQSNVSVYIPGDGHPSIAGHALIAEEIIRTVQRGRLLDH